MYVQDLTENISVSKKYDFVYSQAVMMHLSDDRARRFLSNMGKLSNQYIFFIENFTAHSFYKLVREVLPDFELINNNSKFLQKNFMLLKRK